MQKIKIGIIGAGQIAPLHVKDINQHKQAESIAVADPSQERVKAMADKCNISKTYFSAEELLKDTDIDAVSIAVPNKFHAPLAIAALEAGKHVMLEKPFALNIDQANQVAAVAQKSGKIFTLGMNMRFDHNHQIIKALIENNQLGDIYHAKACWLRRSGIPGMGTWFCHKVESGGGALLDIGVHMLDVSLYLMDNFKPVSVSGAVYTEFGNRGLGEGGWGMSDKGEKIFNVDDFATALIKFTNGATMSLDVSWAIHRETPNKNTLEFYGTEAGVSVLPEPKIFSFSKEKEGEYEVADPKDVEVKYPQGNRFTNWIDTILGKDELCCTLEQALTVQKILDAIYLSSETGKEVYI